MNVQNDLPQVVKTKHSNKMVSFKRINGNSKFYDEIIVKGKVDTVQKAFEFAVKSYGEKECLGTRKVLGKMFDLTDLLCYEFR